MAHIGTSRRFTAAAACSLLLAGCVNFSALDNLADATPPADSRFAQALFQDDVFLAHSFGDVGQASYTAFDQEGSLSLAQVDSDVANLANAYAAKALQLSRGEDVDPEPSKDVASHALRDRLVRALTAGRDTFPRDAARAQADYDCWMLNGTVASQAPAAAQCRASLDVTLSRLENEVPAAAAPSAQPPATPAPASAPETPAAPAPATPAAATPGPQSSSSPTAPTYTVNFALNSTALTPRAMSVLQQAIADARAGGQPKIEVVGHTDTSGGEAYNKGLSLRRAAVVRDSLVRLGARREAIEIEGVGKTDLAVQTADGVREPRNRRSVITLEI
ncbi:MAG: OmpA family protein [Alphaproteobacteria bacterium]|nr:OmpA family protein [Alphaproteobacteria bacterium]MDE2629950.1 OmpA family protein [Alphaproteobacteria bacterium]